MNQISARCVNFALDKNQQLLIMQFSKHLSLNQRN